MSQGKKMNVFQLTVLTMVNMMGSGIILLPTKMAQVGTISVLSWVVTALGAMALAYAFSQAGMYTSKRGGMGGYAAYAYGKSGTFMADYTYSFSLVIANVAIAISAVGYGSVLLGWHLTPMDITLWTIVILWVTTVANFGGPKITGKIGTVTVWGIIIPIVVLSVIGWFYFSGTRFVNSWDPHSLGFLAGINKSVPLTLWAFLGLESASANMDEVKNPQKNVPIAVLGGTIGAAIMYIASTNVMMGIVPINKLANSNAPFGLVYSKICTPVVGKVVMALMVIACVGSLLGWQFTTASVFKSSAVEKYFPKIFKKSVKNGTPIIGMIILTTVQTILALMTISPTLSKQFTIIVDLAVVTNVIPYILSMGALKTIQYGKGVRRGKQHFNDLIALIASLYSLYAIFTAGSLAIVGGAIVTFAGWTFYGFIPIHRIVKLKTS